MYYDHICEHQFYQFYLVSVNLKYVKATFEITHINYLEYILENIFYLFIGICENYFSYIGRLKKKTQYD